MIQITNYSILVILISAFTITACSSQDPSREKLISFKEAQRNEVKVGVDSNDVDPHFEGDTLIQSVSGPKTIVRSIFEDSQERIWLATWDGIVEYDDKIFINHTNQSGLRRYRVFDITEDKKGNVWFATIGAGVYRFGKEKFQYFTMDDGMANNSVQTLYNNNKSELWLGTQNGISIYDQNSFKTLALPGDQNNNDINSIVEITNGIYWIGTRGDAQKYDGFTFTKIMAPDGYPFINVRCLIKDHQDQIWLAGNNGLWKYDGSEFVQYNTQFVGYVYEDQNKNIWTSTSVAGMDNWELFCYEKGEKQGLKIHRPYHGMLFDIMEDNQGNIWIGSLNGPIRFDGRQFEYFR